MNADLEVHAPEDDTRVLILSWIATKRSVSTRAAYARDVAEWVKFLDERGTHLLDASETAAALWARQLESAGRAASTVARKMTAVSSFYAWAVKNRHIAENPFAALDRPEVDYDTSHTPGLTRDQADALLEAADKETLRTAALVAALIYTGARVSEVTGANIGDYGYDRGHRVLRVKRKGGKIQSLVVPAPAVARLDAYLASRQDVSTVPALPGDTAGVQHRVLFATSTGSRMYRQEVRHLLQRLGRAAGLPDELAATLSAHSMRHAFGTLTLDAGAPLRDVQDAMGHADPRTTRRYDRSRGNLDRSPGLALAGYLARGRLRRRRRQIVRSAK